MGLGHAPSIVTGDLVSYYDIGNVQKSWKGSPTTNLYADGNFSSGATHPVNGGGTVVVDPTNPSRKVIKFSPSAGNQYHGRDIPAVVSTVYSLQMEVYVSGDFNGTNVMMYPEQGGAGAGVSYNLNKKGTWQTLKYNNKAATTTNIRMLAYVLSSFTTGYVLATNIQVEQGLFCTPFVNGTRTNTQALVDLTSKNIITSNGLTYDSNGNFSFNGTSSYLDLGFSRLSPMLTPTTYEMWFKNNGNSTYVGLIGASSYQSSGFGVGFMGNNQIMMIYNGAASNKEQTFTYDSSTVSHGVFVFNGRNMTAYRNGVYLGSVSTTFDCVTNTDNIYVGSNRQGGWTLASADIYNVKVYNRELSLAEVNRNFNALRGRFGL